MNELMHSLLGFLHPEAIFGFLKQQLTQNQFSQGAMVAAILGGALAWGRSVPGKIVNFFTRTFTTTVRFNSDSADYEVINRFITLNVIKSTFSRNFNYQCETAFDSEEWKEVTKHRGLTAGYGTHFGLFNKWPVLVERTIEEASQTREFKEYTTVTLLGRSKARLARFSDAVTKAAGAGVDVFDRVPVHINSGSYWQKMGRLPLRRLDSVFTADGAGQKVIETIKAFEAKKEEHHRLGLPHHLGIMLHGEPGCGKSSLIHAVASETKRSIFYLNLGSVDSDSDLTSLINGNRDWSKIILAIEDIDAAGVKVNRSNAIEETNAGASGSKKGKKNDKASASSNKSPVSLSALLNVLDGILCPDGLVVVATTNHHEALDPALKRPGRFDHTIELGKLGRKDFERMSKLFGRDPSEFNIANDIEMTGAEMRARILGVA